MPRIAKGGKYVYGWSRVGSGGRVVIPKEALEEYNLKASDKVILMPGSKRSGGFGLTNVILLEKSRLSVILDENPKLAGFHLPEGEPIEIVGKPYSWVKLNKDGSITVPLKTLKEYGVNLGDLLLSVRGSRVAIGFSVRGPLIDEAKKHSSLRLFE